MLSGQVIRFDQFEVDLSTYELRRSGLRVRLEKQPFELLILLVSSGGRVVTRQDIIDKLWGKDIFLETDQGINNAIRKIRLALRDDADRSRFVETVIGKGYRFIAPVVECRQDSAGTKELLGDVPPAPAILAQSVKKPGKPHYLLVGVVTVLGLTCAAITASLAVSRDWLRRVVYPPAPHINSVLVLPLENLSHDPEQEYFADGMTDALITDLAKMRVPRIISRTSAMHYKRTRKTLKEIGDELGVDAVVEGTVLRSGDRVRITARLVQVSTDQHLWAEIYERDLPEVLELQDQVATDISRQINIHLMPLNQMRPTNPRAYEAYLRGRYFFYKHTGEGWDRGIENFNQALQIDPNYAAAYAGLADCYLLQGTSGTLPPKLVMPKGKVAALKALELDDALAEAHFSLAFAHAWYDWDLPVAEREFRRGFDLNPNYALGHQWYSLYLSILGRFEEAVAEQRHALELDPLSVIINANLARSLYFARRYDQAITQARKTLEMDPNFGQAVLYLGRAYAQKGMHKEFVALMQQYSSPSEALAIGRAFKTSGYRGALKELLKREDLAYEAPLYALLGDRDRAFESLQKCYEERCRYIPYLKAQPDFDSLRSDPRYPDLLRRVGLPP